MRFKHFRKFYSNRNRPLQPYCLPRRLSALCETVILPWKRHLVSNFKLFYVFAIEALSIFPVWIDGITGNCVSDGEVLGTPSKIAKQVLRRESSGAGQSPGASAMGAELRGSSRGTAAPSVRGVPPGCAPSPREPPPRPAAPAALPALTHAAREAPPEFLRHRAHPAAPRCPGAPRPARGQPPARPGAASRGLAPPGKAPGASGRASAAAPRAGSAPRAHVRARAGGPRRPRSAARAGRARTARGERAELPGEPRSAGGPAALLHRAGGRGRAPRPSESGRGEAEPGASGPRSGSPGRRSCRRLPRAGQHLPGRGGSRERRRAEGGGRRRLPPQPSPAEGACRWEGGSRALLDFCGSGGCVVCVGFFF